MTAILCRVILILQVAILPSAAAANGTTLHGKTMGTTYTITVSSKLSDKNADTIKAKIDDLLKKFSTEFSTYDTRSQISSFNQTQTTEPFPVSRRLAVVAKLAIDLSARTQGTFDPTIAPLLSVWGLGSQGKQVQKELPSQSEVDAARAYVGISKLSVTIDPPRLWKMIPELRIDLSALAKGYAVDELGGLLEQVGVQNYMIEVGGEIRTRGQNPKGEDWQIGIAAPDKNRSDFSKVVPLVNKSIATSGDYQKYVEVSGKRIAHIIDPRTGKPVTHKLASATVIDRDCAIADAYATALMVAGETDAKVMANNLKIPVLLIIRSGSAFINWTSRAWQLQVER